MTTSDTTLTLTPKENGHGDTDSQVQSDEELELQKLVSARSQRPASAPGPKVSTPTVRIEADESTRKSTSSLKINIPQV